MRTEITKELEKLHVSKLFDFEVKYVPFHLLRNFENIVRFNVEMSTILTFPRSLRFLNCFAFLLRTL